MIYNGPLKLLDLEDQITISRSLKEGAAPSKDEGRGA